MLRISDMKPGEIAEIVETIDGETRVTMRRMIWPAAPEITQVRPNRASVYCSDKARWLHSLQNQREPDALFHGFSGAHNGDPRS